MRDRVRLLYGVADGVDVGIVRLVRVRDGDAAARPELQAGRFRESHIGSHPDRADDKFCREGPSIGKRHGGVVHRCHRRSGLDVNAVRDQLVLDENGELRIERRKHLRRGLDDRDLDALHDEVLGHLEPDEPRTDHDRGRRRNVDVGQEPGCVFDRP